MGDPRKLKAKYSGPGHPWQSARLEEERVLLQEYGLKTKRELWKVSSKLKALATQAKRLIALRTKQAELEKKQLIDRASRLGLLASTSELGDILGLNIKDLLNRRLQTLLVKRGLAKTQGQARQFIVHQHVIVGGKTVTAPSYLVPIDEEASITFVSNSTLANSDHPERSTVKPGTPPVEEETHKEEVKEEKKESSPKEEKKVEVKAAPKGDKK